MSSQLSPARWGPSNNLWRLAGIAVIATGCLVWAEMLAGSRSAALIGLTLVCLAVGAVACFAVMSVRQRRWRPRIGLLVLAGAAGVASAAAGPYVLAPILAAFAGWLFVAAYLAARDHPAARLG